MFYPLNAIHESIYNPTVRTAYQVMNISLDLFPTFEIYIIKL